MQNAQTLTQQPPQTEYVERKKVLDEAIERLLHRIFVCSHPQLSRPFTREGRTFRTCLTCGMHRDFDLRTWRTFGPYHRNN